MTDTPRTDAAIGPKRELRDSDFVALAAIYTDVLQVARTMERELTAQVSLVELRGEELETERLRLAACSTAALGYFIDCADKFKSASLDDVLALVKREKESRAYAEGVAAPARELLYLYDWRPELAKREKDHANQVGFGEGDEAAWTAAGKELKRLLREYGERKKAGWIALRAALQFKAGGGVAPHVAIDHAGLVDDAEREASADQLGEKT